MYLSRRNVAWAACPTCGGNWCGVCVIVRQHGDRLHLRCMGCLDEFDTALWFAIIAVGE